jgi:hypothetical protein
MTEASTPLVTIDIRGTLVFVGTVVRVLFIPESTIDRLDESEKGRVLSMVGETFEVYEVNGLGGAWVEKWWHESDSEAISHSLALDPNQMLVVQQSPALDSL